MHECTSSLVVLLIYLPVAIAANKPNIVLILADDMGYANGVGDTEIPIPNLKRLAAEGVSFSAAYVSAPVCTPSRMGLMSGCHKQRFGVYGNIYDHELSQRLRTVDHSTLDSSSLTGNASGADAILVVRLPSPFKAEKLRTIHGAPIYLTVDDGRTNIQGVEILEADREAFNGLVNVIGKVIADPMELPEKDLTKIDGIAFAQQALIEGSKLYDEGKCKESFELYARRGYELADKYGRFFSGSSLLSSVRLSSDPVQEFADNAWDSRNAFRKALRELEGKTELIEDQLQIEGDKSADFGR